MTIPERAAQAATEYYAGDRPLRTVIADAIRAAVAEEREAILLLGKQFDNDCCQVYQDAIRKRGQP